MERHAAWLTALVVVLLVWFIVICCGAKSKHAARSQIRHESTEHAAGEVQNGPSDGERMTDVQIGDGSCLVEVERGCGLPREAIETPTSTQANRAKVSTEAVDESSAESCAAVHSGVGMPARGKSRSDDGNAQEDEKGTSSVAINLGRS